MTRSYCEDDVGRREGWATAVETGTYGRQLCLTVFPLPARHGNVAAGGIGCCDVTRSRSSSRYVLMDPEETTSSVVASSQ